MIKNHKNIRPVKAMNLATLKLKQEAAQDQTPEIESPDKLIRR
jgi:hypothetical protein